MTMDIKTAGVIGAGTMGSGIARLFAQNGVEVRLYDLSEDILAGAEDRILRGLHRAEKPEAFSLVRKTTRLEDIASCEFVVEAVNEDLDVKKDLFRRLDSLMDPPRILATNTSSLPVSKIASATENPDRVVGMHFFNPVPVMRLVEIVHAEQTGEKTLKTTVGLAKRLGKTAVICKDTPGFIANRVVRPFYLLGMKLLEQGAGSPAEIDRAMREQGNFRMGPLELVDLIGLDVNLSISRGIYEALGRPERLKPRDVQAALVSKGNLGRKNGRGFYLYEGDAAGMINPILQDIVPDMGSKPVSARSALQFVLEGVINEAKLAAQENVATQRDIDTAMRLGMNWPKGPFEWNKTL